MTQPKKVAKDYSVEIEDQAAADVVAPAEAHVAPVAPPNAPAPPQGSPCDRQHIDRMHRTMSDATRHLDDVNRGASTFNWVAMLPSVIQVLSAVAASLPNPVAKAVISAAVLVLQSLEHNPTASFNPTAIQK